MSNIFREILKLTFILCGIISASFGLKGFLLSTHFIDGGVTGISMLISNVTKLPLYLIISLVNLPFIILAYKQIGKLFALKSAVAIIGLAFSLAFLEFPFVTSDKLLISVFGGFFIGAGIGLAIRGGAVLDGTEIVALLISKGSNYLKVGDVILILNIIIFSTAAFYLGIEIALYSMLTYFSASKTVDFLIHGIEEYTAVTIISEKNNQIREAILTGIDRGVTIYKGQRGWTNAEQDILLCVVTRLELGRIKSLAGDIDPNAFILVHFLADVSGGVIKKSAIH